MGWHARCPLRVIFDRAAEFAYRPMSASLRKRQKCRVAANGAKYQEATYAPQQKHRYSITSSASPATGTAVQV